MGDVDDDCIVQYSIIGRMDDSKRLQKMRELRLIVCTVDLLLMFGEVRLRDTIR